MEISAWKYTIKFLSFFYMSFSKNLLRARYAIAFYPLLLGFFWILDFTYQVPFQTFFSVTQCELTNLLFQSFFSISSNICFLQSQTLKVYTSALRLAINVSRACNV